MRSAWRVVVCAYTASFRPPGIAGYQPTLPVPPLSTVYGLIAAALGRDADPRSVWVGYRFTCAAQATDIETIIKFVQGKPERNKLTGWVESLPVQREFLYDARLTLYIPATEELARAFRAPHYPLLLGRSQDVAYVESLERTELEPVSSGEVEGVLLPLPPLVNGRVWVYSLPTYLPTHPPRKPLAVKPFQVVLQRTTVHLDNPSLLHCDTTTNEVVPIYEYAHLLPGTPRQIEPR